MTYGVSQFLLDFHPFHGKESKYNDMTQDLPKKQAETWHAQNRSEKERISNRCSEYLSSKINAIIKCLDVQ